MFCSILDISLLQPALAPPFVPMFVIYIFYLSSKVISARGITVICDHRYCGRMNDRFPLGVNPEVFDQSDVGNRL